MRYCAIILMTHSLLFPFQF